MLITTRFMTWTRVRRDHHSETEEILDSVTDHSEETERDGVVVG